jgi:serine/threonine-protein kinase
VGSHALLYGIGQGAHARVDLALDLRPRDMVRLAVLKRLLPGATQEARQRFEREARLSLRMSHPAIARTIDVEVIDGELCIVQEYVSGFTLHYLIETATRYQLPAELVVYIASEVARALSYLHQFESGVLHRDVTPENIIVSFDGVVKLLDFGVAKVLGDESTTLTIIGDVVGRPAYLAPEVAAGGPATPQSDIYSLGVVMWRALAEGRQPEVIGGVVLPPSTFNAAISGSALDTIVLRCLKPEPDQRFQDSAELYVGLRSVLPAAYFGERELIAYLRSHSLAANNRDGLDRDVEALVARIQAERTKTSKLESSGGPRSSRTTGPVVAIAVFVALMALVIHHFGQRPESHRGAGGEAARVGQDRPVLDVTLLPSIPLAEPKPAAGGGPEPPSETPPSFPPSRPPSDIEARALATPTNAPRGQHGRGRERSAVAQTRSLDEPRPRGIPVPAESSTVTVGQLLALAREKVAHGDYSTAETLASRALSLGGGSAAHLVLGIINEGQGLFSAAESEYLQATGAEAERRLATVREIQRSEPGGHP